MSRHYISSITEPRMEIPRPLKKVKESTESARTQVSGSFFQVRNPLGTAHSQNFQPILRPKEWDEDQIQVKTEANRSWIDSAKTKDIKKMFYDLDNQCKICGMKIIRGFRQHISTHRKKEKKFSKDFIFEQKNNSLKIKCKLCSKPFGLHDGDNKLENHYLKCKEKTQSAIKTLMEADDDDGIDHSLFESFEGSNSAWIERLQKELECTNNKLDDLTQEQYRDRNNFMNGIQTNHFLKKQIEDIRSEINLNLSLTENFKEEIKENKNELNLMQKEQVKTYDDLNIVIDTTEILKTQVDNIEKKVEEMTPCLKIFEKKIDDFEKILPRLLNYLREKEEQPIQNSTRANILDRIKRKPKEDHTDKIIEID